MSILEKKIKNIISKKIKKILKETYGSNQSNEEINALIFSYPSDQGNIHKNFTKKILYYKSKREYNFDKDHDLANLLKENKAVILLNRFRKAIDPYDSKDILDKKEKNFKDWVNDKAKKLVGILDKSIIYVDLDVEEVKKQFNNSEYSNFEEFINNKIEKKEEHIQYEFLKKFLFEAKNKVLDVQGREISNLQKETGNKRQEDVESKQDFGKVINIPDNDATGREISDEKNKTEIREEEKGDLSSKLKALKNLMIQLERGDISKNDFEKEKSEIIKKIKEKHDLNISEQNLEKIKSTIKEIPEIWKTHEEAILAKYRKINIDEHTKSKDNRYGQEYKNKIKDLIKFAYTNNKKALGDKIYILYFIENAKRSRLKGTFKDTDMSGIKKYAEENNLIDFYYKHALGESKKKSKKIMTEKQLRQFIRENLI